MDIVYDDQCILVSEVLAIPFLLILSEIFSDFPDLVSNIISFFKAFELWDLLFLELQD